ncbi:ADP-ribosylation factor protein 3 [Coemansia erecta]|nr:ADP-ribosylation factor protein 3 [Coemansia sp. RSA 2618]KAJ2816985.1 ADP-ribosylation factor protein 3 [Coemansia erecta]
MYTLVSGAYRYLTRHDEYTVLILGLDNSGKTTLLESLKHEYTGVLGMDPQKIQPTVGVNIARLRINKRVLRCMDLGGQADLRGIWQSYFRDAHALLFVVDASDSARMAEAQGALVGLARAAELANMPVLVLANKQDATDVRAVAQVKEMVNSVADELDPRAVRVVGASGIDGSGTRDAIDWLFSRVVENSALRPPVATE